MEVDIKCRLCGNLHKVEVAENDFLAHLKGEKKVQEIFPYLSAEDRELLISGICPKCWNDIIPKEEEEEED